VTVRLSTLLLVAALSSGGCTKWRKEAESLQGKLAAAQTRITAHEQAIADRDASIAKLDARVRELDAAAAELQSKIDALEADLDDEREKSSRILADRGALREEVASMKTALAELEARKRQAEAQIEAYRDLVARFQTLIDAGKLDVRIVDGRMVVVLKTDILFPSGSAELSPEGRDAIGQVAAVLSEIPDRRFQVEGHTDDVPIRVKYPSNWYLASARAIGVVERMIEAGMAPSRVSAAAFADTNPVAPNTTEEGRALNRRIEIVVVPDLSGLPGYDELSTLGEREPR
jgi:chemotaxis protein MotB